MKNRIIATALVTVIFTTLAGCIAKQETTVSEITAHTVSNISETTAETVTKTKHTEKEINTETISADAESAYEPPKSVVTESIPSETQAGKNTKTETVQEKPTENTEIQPKAETPTVSQPQRPSAEDIETLTAQYLNEWRNTADVNSATVLQGLTSVARYRAEQLITDFSHNSNPDACTVLKYGEYIDMTELGLSESDNYYLGYDAEACAKGNFTGTAEDIARKIADGFRNSSGHWRYVGSDKYKYMAVGLTYDTHTAKWYCCVCMSSKNYGG